MPFRTLKTLFVPLSLFFAIMLTHAGPVSRMQTVNEIIRHPQDSAGIEILATAVLDNIVVNGERVTDLSALAWDDDEGILLAVSDNGFLLHLQPVFIDGTLSAIELIAGFPLLDGNGRPLQGKQVDAEGMAITGHRNNRPGDTELYISFERNPRIMQYTLEGRIIGTVPLPKRLADIINYRAENNALEALVYHDTLGLLTGPEFPLQSDSKGQLVIYALDDRRWRLLAHDPVNGALVGLARMADGRVMVLERAFGGVIPELVITLHAFDPENHHVGERLITLQPGDRLFNENFEGLTLYDRDRYFMVSDDNNHPLKQTMLVFFRLLEDE